MITVNNIDSARPVEVFEGFSAPEEAASGSHDVIKIRFDRKETVDRLVRSTRSAEVSFDKGAMKFTAIGNDPRVLINLEEIGISADKYKYVVMICKMPIGTEKTEAETEMFFCAGDIGDPTEGASKCAKLGRAGSYNTFFVSLESADHWKGSIRSLAIDCYKDAVVGDSYLVDSILFFKDVGVADRVARREMWRANQGVELPCAPTSLSELKDKLLEDASDDVNSSEHVKDGVLRISCGTADRLTKTRIENRIKDCIYNTYYVSVGVEIISGFEALKAEYEKSESAAGNVTCKFTADGSCAVVSLPVEFFVKEIIFDHDLGSDCDDGGAAAMLIKAHREGYCKVLAITGCVFDPYASYCIGVMCSYFGVHDIDVGVNRERDTLNTPDWHACSKGPAEKYLGDNFPILESNVPLIRRKLAASRGNVTVVSTGCLATLMALMESVADDYSELDGASLFRDKVGHYVCGGGSFPSGDRESNFLCDPEAVNVTVNKYLAGYDRLTFVGCEVAGIVLSGGVLMNYDDYILRDIYNYLRPGSCNHNSWDPGVMHYSIFGSAYKQFAEVKNCTVTPYGDGYMTLTDGGIHDFVVRIGSEHVLSDVFNYWMVPEA